MKPLKLLLLICFITANQADAQIWKKIKNAVKEGVENTIEKRAEDESEKKTDEALDEVFERKNNNDESAPLINLGGEAPKATYTFNYKYVMQYSDDKDTYDIIYYLNSKAPYFGSKMPTEDNTNNITVFDTETNTSHSFTDMNGKKTRMSVSINVNKIAKEAKEKANITVTPLNQQKTILGHTCKGYNIVGSTTDDKHMETTVWVYENPPVNFAMGLGMMKQKQLSGMSSALSQFENGLVMEMEVYTYTLGRNGKRKNEEHTKFVCKSFEANSFSINTSQYQSMF